MRRLVVIASGATFAEALFFSVLTPLLPHYVTALGLSKYEAGLLVGSYAAGALVGALPAGLVASTFDAKVTVIVGLGSMAALSSCFGFVSSLWRLELVRFGLGVGAAFAWTGALTWLVNDGPRGRRAELMGVATAAAAMGALLGPAVGAGATVVGIPLTFLAIALPAVLLAVWAMDVPCSQKGERQPVTVLLTAIRRPGLVAGLWLLVLPSFAFGVIGVLAPIRMSVLGLSGVEIGGIFVLAGVVQAFVSVGAGRWADAYGQSGPLRVSLVCLAATSLLVSFVSSVWAFSVCVILAAMASMAFFAPGMALLADHAEGAGLEYAYGFALLTVAWAPGNLAGSVAGAAVAGLGGDAVAYQLLAVLCVLSLVVTIRSPGLLRAGLKPQSAEVGAGP